VPSSPIGKADAMDNRITEHQAESIVRQTGRVADVSVAVAAYIEIAAPDVAAEIRAIADAAVERAALIALGRAAQ
jgi:hypothetical protein